jgi:hypothetical protein
MTRASSSVSAVTVRWAVTSFQRDVSCVHPCPQQEITAVRHTVTADRVTEPPAGRRDASGRTRFSWRERAHGWAPAAKARNPIASTTSSTRSLSSSPTTNGGKEGSSIARQRA